jgi:hypothetical protein
VAVGWPSSRAGRVNVQQPRHWWPLPRNLISFLVSLSRSCCSLMEMEKSTTPPRPGRGPSRLLPRARAPRRLKVATWSQLPQTPATTELPASAPPRPRRPKQLARLRRPPRRDPPPCARPPPPLKYSFCSSAVTSSSALTRSSASTTARTPPHRIGRSRALWASLRAAERCSHALRGPPLPAVEACKEGSERSGCWCYKRSSMCRAPSVFGGLLLAVHGSAILGTWCCYRRRPVFATFDV